MAKFIQFLVLHIHFFILHFLNNNDTWKETKKKEKENERKEKCNERRIKM